MLNMEKPFKKKFKLVIFSVASKVMCNSYELKLTDLNIVPGIIYCPHNTIINQIHQAADLERVYYQPISDEYLTVSERLFRECKTSQKENSSYPNYDE